MERPIGEPRTKLLCSGYIKMSLYFCSLSQTTNSNEISLFSLKICPTYCVHSHHVVCYCNPKCDSRYSDYLYSAEDHGGVQAGMRAVH